MSKLLLCNLFVLFANVVLGQSRFIPSEQYMRQSTKALHLYEQKQYLHAARLYDTLLGPDNGQGLGKDRYNAARAWAAAENAEKSFHYLNQSLIHDKYRDLPRLLSDPALLYLHNDGRWQQVISRVKKNRKKADEKLNRPLVTLLDSIYYEDQNERRKIDTIQKQFGWNSTQVDSMWRKIRRKDSINTTQIKQLIDNHGWLGPDEVGEKGAKTIFLVIQHSDSLTQVTYLPKLRKAVEKGDASPRDLALLEDRVLIKQGKEQLYGSQLTTDQRTGKYVFYPIEDEVNVNKRRASVELEPIEEYAKYFNVRYASKSSD
jgi:hypothetical protein